MADCLLFRWKNQLTTSSNRKRKHGRFTHAEQKIRHNTLVYGAIAEIHASYRKSGPTNTTVTSDFRPEVEKWQCRACALKSMQYNTYLRQNRRNSRILGLLKIGSRNTMVMSDFDKIWHADAVRPSCAYPTVKNLKFLKSKMAVAAAILKNRKSAISLERFDRSSRNLARWRILRVWAGPELKMFNFYKSKRRTAEIVKNGKSSAIEQYLLMRWPVRVKSAIHRVGKV